MCRETPAIGCGLCGAPPKTSLHNSATGHCASSHEDALRATTRCFAYRRIVAVVTDCEPRSCAPADNQNVRAAAFSSAAAACWLLHQLAITWTQPLCAWA
jgi:hypothetical protein